MEGQADFSPFRLTNEEDGNDTERYKRIKFVMVGGNDFSAKFLGESNPETVCKRNPAARLKPPDSLPKLSAQVTALDHSIGK